MSILNDDEKFSNLLEDNMKYSENPAKIFDVEESSYSDIISNKSRPLFINNENFINYFMHIDYNTPLNSFKDETPSSQSNTPQRNNEKSNNEKTEINKSININENSNESLLKKTKRHINKDFGIIVDKLTGITYNEEEDPINYRKAKKRIQNRESALRMKKLREFDSNKINEEINHLREDNIRLINENVSLKKEKVFLIDQIKFMQKIIKESNLEFKSNNNENISQDKEEINIKGPVLFYDGSKQKIKGKIFNVFVICMLSIIYIVGECSYGENNKGLSYNIGNEGGRIQLNSVKEIKNKFNIWNYLSKIILGILGLLIIPWLKGIGKIPSLIKKRKFL